MKKVSTVAAKASKKISQQKLTVGLDLGDRNSWYCVGAGPAFGKHLNSGVPRPSRVLCERAGILTLPRPSRFGK